jgi:hypothetical protein
MSGFVREHPVFAAATLAGAGVAVVRELVLELVFGSAADWIKANAGLGGDFLAWRWSTLILAIVVAAGTAWILNTVLNRSPISPQDRGADTSWPLVSPHEEIILMEPRDGARITSPIKVRGYARTFEGNVVIETRTGAGNWEVIAAISAGMTEGHTPFSADIRLGAGHRQLRIGSSSPRDGEWIGVELGITVDATAGAPRYLGVGMMKVFIEGLTGDPSEVVEIPSDIVDLVRHVNSVQQTGAHARASQFQGKSNAGLDMSTVLSMALADGYVTISRKSDSYLDIVLTERGQQLLQALEAGALANSS